MKKLLILVATAMFLFACSGNTKTEAEDASDTPTVTAEWEVITLPVKGMTCDGCENAIKAGIESLEGIGSVESSHEEGWTKVKYDKNQTSPPEIAGKITETGYEVLEKKEAETL